MRPYYTLKAFGSTYLVELYLNDLVSLFIKLGTGLILIFMLERFFLCYNLNLLGNVLQRDTATTTTTTTTTNNNSVIIIIIVQDLLLNTMYRIKYFVNPLYEIVMMVY